MEISVVVSVCVSKASVARLLVELLMLTIQHFSDLTRNSAGGSQVLGNTHVVTTCYNDDSPAKICTGKRFLYATTLTAAVTVCVEHCFYYDYCS